MNDGPFGAKISTAPVCNDDAIRAPDYGALFSEHITQANQGCDFGFLARRGRNPEPDPR